MIRDATVDDIPRLLEMGRRFFDAMGRPEVGRFNPDVAVATCRNLMASDLGVVLVSETGMIGGLVYPYYMTGQMTAQEFFWWDESGGGLKLLRAFEEAVKGRGAETVSMISLESLAPERVDRIYRRAGYSPMERSYLKVL